MSQSQCAVHDHNDRRTLPLSGHNLIDRWTTAPENNKKKIQIQFLFHPILWKSNCAMTVLIRAHEFWIFESIDEYLFRGVERIAVHRGLLPHFMNVDRCNLLSMKLDDLHLLIIVVLFFIQNQTEFVLELCPHFCPTIKTKLRIWHFTKTTLRSVCVSVRRREMLSAHCVSLHVLSHSVVVWRHWSRNSGFEFQFDAKIRNSRKLNSADTVMNLNEIIGNPPFESMIQWIRFVINCLRSERWW